IREVYYAGAEGIVLVFDLTRLETLNNLYKWIDEAMGMSGNKIPFIVVGNKSDLYIPHSLDEIRPVINEFMNDLAGYTFFDKINYIETSALLGINIVEAFDQLVDEMDLIYAERLGIEYQKTGQVEPSEVSDQGQEKGSIKGFDKDTLPKLPDVQFDRPSKPKKEQEIEELREEENR
ncbi:MAG: hypothetical protein ACW98K_04430, partial [Candidatus Kariarchaeaceae archaeon]